MNRQLIWYSAVSYWMRNSLSLRWVQLTCCNEQYQSWLQMDTSRCVLKQEQNLIESAMFIINELYFEVICTRYFLHSGENMKSSFHTLQFHKMAKSNHNSNFQGTTCFCTQRLNTIFGILCKVWTSLLHHELTKLLHTPWDIFFTQEPWDNPRYEALPDNINWLGSRWCNGTLAFGWDDHVKRQLKHTAKSACHIHKGTSSRMSVIC